MNARRAMVLISAIAGASLIAEPALAQGLPAVTVSGTGAQQQYSLTLQLLALMTVLTLLPSIVLMMTSFVRIIIVMSLLRQALGTGQTPPNQVLVGLALFLTLFIMSPVLSQVYNEAISPYLANKLGFEQALQVAEKIGRAHV